MDIQNNFTVTDDRTRVAIGVMDRVVIEGVANTHGMTTLGGAILNRDDATGRSISLTNADLRTLAHRKRIRVDRDHYSPTKTTERLKGRGITLSDLSPEHAARFGIRSGLVQSVIHLRAEKKLKLTDESIATNMDAIYGLAIQYCRRHDLGVPGHALRAYDLKRRYSPSQIRKMRTARARYGEVALVDDMAKRGGKGSSLDAAVSVILWRHI